VGVDVEIGVIIIFMGVSRLSSRLGTGCSRGVLFLIFSRRSLIRGGLLLCSFIVRRRIVIGLFVLIGLMYPHAYIFYQYASNTPHKLSNAT